MPLIEDASTVKLEKGSVFQIHLFLYVTEREMSVCFGFH